MFKNTAGQSVTLSAYDSATGLQKTGDSSNMLFYVDKDDAGPVVIAAASGVPTQISSTLAKGDYKIALAQAETNADKLHFTGVSSTTGIVVLSKTIYTVPANFTKTSIDSNGRLDIININGQSQTALDLGANWTAVRAAHLDVDIGSRMATFTQPTGFLASTFPATVGDATAANQTTLLNRLTAARAGYLDNLNVGGAVASHADIAAINQSASKHIIITTVGQYAPGETYTVEMRTFAAADGSAVNADTTPTLTATGNVSGSLAANLSAATNPATGVYRWTYTPGATPTLEQIRFDGSATISSATFTLSAYAQTVDEPSVVWTSTDQSHLTSIFNKLPSNNIADETIVLAAIGTPQQAGSAVVLPTIPTDWIAAAGVKADAVTKIQAGLATSSQIPANFTAATFVSPGVFATAALANGPGGGGNVTVGGYAVGQDPATLILDPATSTHNTPGSFGHAIGAAGNAADPWVSDLSVYIKGQAGYDLHRQLADVAGVPIPEALRRVGATTAGGLSGSGSTKEIFVDFAGAVAVSVTYDVANNRVVAYS